MACIVRCVQYKTTQQTQVILFFTANCLYIIFFIFHISLQFTSKFNVSVTKMLQLLGSSVRMTPAGASPLFPTRDLLPSPLIWPITFKNTPPRLLRIIVVRWSYEFLALQWTMCQRRRVVLRDDNHSYCLRPKRHELKLAIRRDSRNFFQRLLFKDMY